MTCSECAKRDAEIERLRAENARLRVDVQLHERTIKMVQGAYDASRASSADIYRKQEAENTRLREALEFCIGQFEHGNFGKSDFYLVVEKARAALGEKK